MLFTVLRTKKNSLHLNEKWYTPFNIFTWTDVLNIWIKFILNFNTMWENILFTSPASVTRFFAFLYCGESSEVTIFASSLYIRFKIVNILLWFFGKSYYILIQLSLLSLISGLSKIVMRMFQLNYDHVLMTHIKRYYNSCSKGFRLGNLCGR